MVVGKYGDAPWGAIDAPKNDESFGPQSTGIPGGVRLIYVPESEPITLRNLAQQQNYSAAWFDPVTGKQTDFAPIRADDTGVANCPAPQGLDHDWVLILIPPAAATLSDLWDSKAAWAADAENVGRGFNFHFLSIAPAAGEFWAYYIHTSALGESKMAIGRARGADGIHWTDDGIVLEVTAEKSWDDRLTGFPGVWKDGDTWYLVYEGAGSLSPGDIGLATSTDGKSFVKHPGNPILRHETTGWERANIGTPSLFKENGIWYLFYHGYDGKVCQIGVASGKSLTELTKSPSNPILPVATDANAWDSGTTGKRSSIVKEGKFYYFAFEGSTPPPFPQARWSSGLARTAELTGKWEKTAHNPMIPQTTAGFGHDGPELLCIEGKWYLYVRTPATNTTARFRLDPKTAH
jgi:hypothetical protein